MTAFRFRLFDRLFWSGTPCHSFSARICKHDPKLKYVCYIHVDVHRHGLPSVQVSWLTSEPPREQIKNRTHRCGLCVFLYTSMRSYVTYIFAQKKNVLTHQRRKIKVEYVPLGQAPVLLRKRIFGTWLGFGKNLWIQFDIWVCRVHTVRVVFALFNDKNMLGKVMYRRDPKAQCTNFTNFFRRTFQIERLFFKHDYDKIPKYLWESSVLLRMFCGMCTGKQLQSWRTGPCNRDSLVLKSDYRNISEIVKSFSLATLTKNPVRADWTTVFKVKRFTKASNLRTTWINVLFDPPPVFQFQIY